MAAPQGRQERGHLQHCPIDILICLHIILFISLGGDVLCHGGCTVPGFVLLLLFLHQMDNWGNHAKIQTKIDGVLLAAVYNCFVACGAAAIPADEISGKSGRICADGGALLIDICIYLR